MKQTKGEAKKQGLLDVARRLFYEKGYEDTSVQDIIDEMKTSKGSFYHHFESKIEVLMTLCEQEVERAFQLYLKSSDNEEKIMKKINLLLYFANPIHQGNETFLAVFLPLIAKAEGKSIAAQYTDIIEKTFCPSLQVLLDQGQENGELFLYYPNQIATMVLVLNNNLWKKAGFNLVERKQNNKDINITDYIEMVRAFRFAVERLTDVPFGGIEMISTKEWMSVLEKIDKAIK